MYHLYINQTGYAKIQVTPFPDGIVKILSIMYDLHKQTNILTILLNLSYTHTDVNQIIF